MIEWFDPKDKLPEDGQECLLLSKSEGLISVAVCGPIEYSAAHGFWIDLFASPEAGEVITKNLVAKWTLWELIKPK